MNKILALCFAVLLAACASLPAAGPSKGAILDDVGTGEADLNIVPLSPSVISRANIAVGFGFPSEFFNTRQEIYEIIRPGDSLSITIWENVDNGLFATLGNRVTQLGEMRVAQDGTIFVPYVGKIQAAGRTTEQLRVQISNQLATQTPDPQVEVRRLTPGLSGGVRLITNGGSRNIPFDEGNLTLAGMIASSGVGFQDARSTKLSLVRGSQKGTILLQMLFENSRYDVALRDGDKIFIELDDRSFKRFNESSGAANVPFTEAEMSLLDAITQSGGLNAASADPSGIFIFRRMSAKRGNQIVGENRFQNGAKIVFTINLRDPQGLFLAEDFLMEDDDIIYVTDAPYVKWSRAISYFVGAVGSVNAVQGAATQIQN